VPLDWSNVITGLSAGVIGSLITTFATPALRHYFRKREMKIKEQMSVIKKINKLLSHYHAGSIEKWTFPGWQPSAGFFEELGAVERRLQVLFSRRAWDAYKRVEQHMSRQGGFGRPGSTITPQEFADLQCQLMRILYREIGLKM
jgi:hypothetical protein